MLKNGYVRWAITFLGVMFIGFGIATYRYQHRGLRTMDKIDKIESIIAIDSLRTMRLEVRVDTLEVRLGRVEKAVVK